MRPFLAPPVTAALAPGSPASFSIIIASYQAAGTVAEAVASALTQTVAPHEVIVVDDGSTDDTESVLSPYRSRIVYVRQENRGAPAATNRAAQIASGEFVAILDADDVYAPERIEALSELSAARPDLDVLMTDAYLEVGGEVVGRFSDNTRFAVDRQSVEIFERCFFAWPAVRRRRLLAIGGFDETLRVGYDWECWIRLLHAGARAGSVDQPLMRYRVGEQSLTADRLSDLRARVRILEISAQLDLSPEERGQLERFLARRRRRLLLAEAQQALRAHAPDARRRALGVAGAAGMSPQARARALAAALAPRLAARNLERREAKTGRSRLKRNLPRSP